MKIPGKSFSASRSFGGEYTCINYGLEGGKKADLKKKQRKLIRALDTGKTDIDRNIKEMRLGIYGKAKFYQTIQNAMLAKGYSKESTRIIIEKRVVTL